MLFSDEGIAAYINNHFEPAWQSVRPVPLVRIDFGDGNVITRTLHGNIATYVCSAGGQVLDILPGVYEKGAYLHALSQFVLLTRYLNDQRPSARDSLLCDYHRRQAGDLANNLQPSQFVVIRTGGDMSKALIERSTKVMLLEASNVNQHKLATTGKDNTLRSNASGGLAEWKSLLEDTTLNETIRRRQIHNMLANAVNARPENVTKWLYKNALHADLDDPYLGLGPLLFANYPFNDRIGR